MNYDKIYKQSNNTFGNTASPIVVTASGYIKSDNIYALDIGSGQSRDSIYLARKGFTVTAIEKSDIGAKQLSAMNIPNIKVFNCDVLNYDFPENKFNLIISINVLHFLDKQDALKIINNIKYSLILNGVAAITLLMDNGKFTSNELRDMFSDFEIINYFEKIKHDEGHPGEPNPHDHQIAGIIARKI